MSRLVQQLLSLSAYPLALVLGCAGTPDSASNGVGGSANGGQAGVGVGGAAGNVGGTGGGAAGTAGSAGASSGGAAGMGGSAGVGSGGAAGGAGTAGASGGAAGSAGSAGASSGGAGGNAGAAGAGSGGAAGSGATGGAGGDTFALEAPDNAAELLPWLEAKTYAAWTSEPDYHPSTGPHGDGVKVFYGPLAIQSLRAQEAHFPNGAAVVKELTSAGSLYGWSVYVKGKVGTGDDSFYFYELIKPSTVYGDAYGSTDCNGCHTGPDKILQSDPAKVL